MKTFFNDESGKDELWYEARADEQLIFRFRAPDNSDLKIGDAIAFDWCFLDQEASLPIYKPTGGVTILVRSKDTKDLRDRRVVADLTFEQSGTRIVLLATGQIEISGTHPGSSGAGRMAGMAGFDDVEGFAEYVEGRSEWLGPEWDSAGPLELRKMVLDWIKLKAVPELKAAQNKFKNA